MLGHFNISLKHLKFGVLIDSTHIEGSLSQILYLGPIYLFDKKLSRKKNLQKIPKRFLGTISKF